MLNLLRKAVEYVKNNFEWYDDEDYEEMFAELGNSDDDFCSGLDDSSSSCSGSSSVNPTTGLPMAGGVDIGGNTYGT